MSHQIKNRWVLILLVAAGQFVVLLAGSIWLIGWLESTISDAVRDRVLLNAAAEVEHLTKTIGNLSLSGIAPETEDGRRLHDFILRYEPPRGGNVFVIDADTGAPIGPAVWRHELETVQILTDDGPTDLLAAGRRSGTSTGIVRGLNHDWYVAVHSLNPLPATLLVVHRSTDVQAEVAPVIRTIRAVTLLISGVIVLSSVLLTIAIVRRYENRLAHVNDNLHKLVDMRSRALLKSRSAVIEGLAKLAESRDDETGQHLERIKRYVRILGDELVHTHDELTPELVDTIEETSALHDIGKVGIPDSVLLSHDQLSEDQRTVIEKHPLIGGDTLLAVRRQWGDDAFLVTACEIIFAHHERWDGAGYPFGLAGDMIPIAARIVALADVYDALTSRRTYKDALTHDEAREIIVQGSGTHFDPEVVRAFTARDEDFRTVRDLFAKKWT
ncbi:MAG: HD domain-containing protein [Phycisphaerales bacterium]|nr:HD domain-containing protein [Phycisphaerales bacterium]